MHLNTKQAKNSFRHQAIALEKNQIKSKAELKIEIEEHLRLLEQEFENYFLDLNQTNFQNGK